MNPNEIPLPPAPPSVPVVTGAPAVPSNAQPAQAPSMLDRLREQVMKDVMPSDVDSMQARARAFGAGMLGGQGNFFQRLASGENAIAQLQQQEQQARANRLKSIEENEVRRAEVAVKEAEQRLKENPDSWQAQVAFMNARAHLAQAAASQRDRVVSQQRDREGNLYNIHESGRVARVGGEGGPNFVDPSTTPEARRYAEWAKKREEFQNRVATRPRSIQDTDRSFMATSDALLEQWDRNNPRPRAPWDERPTPGATPTPTTPAATEGGERIRRSM